MFDGYKCFLKYFFYNWLVMHFRSKFETESLDWDVSG
jgi:hypothetical protein